MAGTTTNFGFDYPTSTDYVKDGATAIQTLADDVDGRFGDVGTYPNQIVNRVSGVSRPVAYAMAAGLGTIPAPASAGALATVTITYPAGRFTTTPLTNITPQNSSTNQRIVKIADNTASALTAAQWQTTGGTLQATNINWVAVQMTSAAAAG